VAYGELGRMPRCTEAALLHDLLGGSMKNSLVATAVIAGACSPENLDAKLDQTAPNHTSAMVE
jgi:hypothetical protein